jgi:hypothetical protein
MNIEIISSFETRICPPVGIPDPGTELPADVVLLTVLSFFF